MIFTDEFILNVNKNSLFRMHQFLNKYKPISEPTFYLSKDNHPIAFIGNTFFLKFEDDKIFSRVFYQEYHENVLTAFLLRHNLTHFFEGDVIASLAQRESTVLTRQMS